MKILRILVIKIIILGLIPTCDLRYHFRESFDFCKSCQFKFAQVHFIMSFTFTPPFLKLPLLPP